ncbi:MAG: hypothetical protein IH587_01675 [Anaerolineae bacterium]|nr:hypothetical protein [Anaerolineae bacterium]
MTDLRSPDCRLYVDADMSETELLSLVMQMVFAPDVPTRAEVVLFKNEDYDTRRRTQFPQGFLYFRYYADLYMPDAARKAQAALVGALLKEFWDMGIPSVAASPFEDLLPERGGYKSHAIPWAY